MIDFKLFRQLRTALFLLTNSFFCIICNLANAASEPPRDDYIVKTSGTNWKLLTPANSTQGLSAQNNNLVLIENKEGVKYAPLPKSIKAELEADENLFPSTQKSIIAGSVQGPTNSQVIIHQGVAEAMADGTVETKYAAFRVVEPEDGPPGVQSIFGCKAKWYNKTKGGSFDINKLLPSSTITQKEGGFTGKFSVNAPASGKVGYEFRFAYKAISCIKIPYAFRFDSVYAGGEVDLKDTVISLDGSFSASTGWQSSQLRLFKQPFDFWIGPIPVHLVFKLDTFYGYDAGVTIAGKVALANAATGKYKFDYTCTTDNCAGQHTSTIQFPNPNAGTHTSASIDATISPYLGLEFTGYAYGENILSGGFGAELAVPINAWGTITDICDDGDGDDKNERLSSLLLDINAQLSLYGKWGVSGNHKSRWLDLNFDLPGGWGPVKTSNLQNRHGSREYFALQRSLYFREFNKSDSSALSPILKGPKTAVAGEPAKYTAAMRSCVPARFKKMVTYAIDWGDATTNQATSPSDQATPFSHKYGSVGPKTMTLTTKTDAQGRKYDISTKRIITVTQGSSLAKDYWVTLSPLNEAGSSTQSTRSIRSVIRDGYLYVYVETQGMGKSYSLYINKDGNRSTGHQSPYWNASSGAEVLIQNGLQYNSVGSGWNWVNSGATPKVVNGEQYFEFTIPLDSIGLSQASKPNISLAFALHDEKFNITEKLPIGNAFAAINGSILESAPTSFWTASTPLAQVNGQNASKLKVTIRNGYLYALVEGTNLGDSYALMLNTDGNKSTGHQSIVWTAESGADFMFSNGKLYRSTGTGWNWEAIGSDIGVTLLNQSIEIRIPLNRLNLGNVTKPNISVGFNLFDKKFLPFSKLPVGNSFVPVKDVLPVATTK